MGTVSAVDGSTVTITNTDGTTYTVDATNAKVSKMVDLSVSDIKVGDQVGVMGTISGTSVTATHIMDGVPPARQQNQ
jgi:ABC-type dipeptide/oligopeptide/nickel transport system ATPase component